MSLYYSDYRIYYYEEVLIMKYISVNEAAKKWNISDRRVRIHCEQGKIDGLERDGRAWKIPADAVKPADGRVLRNKKVPKQYIGLFARIDGKKAELSSRQPLTEGEVTRLREEFLIEFTYNSNAIEGNTLTLQETAMVLAEGVTIDQKPLKDHLEAIGHKEAFLYVQELVQEKKKISEKVIKDIHSLILMDRREDKGVYRRIPVRIMGALHEPPQPYIVPVQMEQLIDEQSEMKKTIHPLERIALFHLKFEGIHPFIDGNGRTGRLLLNLGLMQNGYPAINVKFTDRKRYYDCFNTYYGNADASKMVTMIIEYVEEQLDRYLKIIDR